MSMHVEILQPPPPSRRRLEAPLDPVPDRTTFPAMTAQEALRTQNWARVSKQLTMFAFRHTGKRSWANAEDLAQQAIADAYARADGWDPAKQPLMAHLCRRVWGLATNSYHHKRSSFEVAMQSALKSYGVSYDGGRKEIDARSSDDPLDEVVDRQRLAAAYRTQLAQRLAGDETAMLVLSLLLEGTDTPLDQAKASGVPHARLAEARRRVFHHAKKVSKELADEIDSEDESDSCSDEVTS